MMITSPATTPTDDDRLLTFPLVVIDFEATALTLTSYPIEVGIAVAARPRAAIEAWSSLIAPDASWDLDREWDRDAVRVHGITRWQLRDGSPTREVMQKLNHLAGPTGRVWCDGGHYDAYWLSVLAEAAGIKPMFTLCNLATALQIAQIRERYTDIFRGSSAPHRAGPDAKRICSALVGALASR